MAGSASIPASGQLDLFASRKRADGSSGIGTERGVGTFGCGSSSSLQGISSKRAINFANEFFGQGIVIATSSSQQPQPQQQQCYFVCLRSSSGSRSRSAHRSGSHPRSVDYSAGNLLGGESAGASAEEEPPESAGARCVGDGGGVLAFARVEDPKNLNALHVRPVGNMGAEQSTSGQQGQRFGESLEILDRSSSSSSSSSSRDGSTEAGEEDGQDQHLMQPHRLTESSVPQRWDVVGLGQAMVDFSGIVDDQFLNDLGLVKGTRKVVTHDERGNILRALGGWKFKITAGGSLSNSLVALARLGYGYNGEDTPLRVAMTGSVGRDVLGDFYRTKLRKAGVHFLADPISEGVTGSVIVCVTPDAQRTMLSYQGMSSTVNLDGALKRQISMSRVFVVEGYLWELPETVDTIAAACKLAKSHGALVALTASDTTCVARHREKMWDVMTESADILFANFDEAQALLGPAESCDMTPGEAASRLSMQCSLVSVTDGAQGSYIGMKGEVIYINPASCLPVDTCGAGDAYAAGILYGLLRGVPDIKSIGRLAAKVAAVVVGQQGPRLKEQDARMLSTSMPSITCLLEGLNLDVRRESEQSVNA